MRHAVSCSVLKGWTATTIHMLTTGCAGAGAAGIMAIGEDMTLLAQNKATQATACCEHVLRVLHIACGVSDCPSQSHCCNAGTDMSAFEITHNSECIGTSALKVLFKSG